MHINSHFTQQTKKGIRRDKFMEFESMIFIFSLLVVDKNI